MYRKVKIDIREIIKTLCKYKKVEIIEGAVCEDHEHLCIRTCVHKHFGKVCKCEIITKHSAEEVLIS